MERGYTRDHLEVVLRNGRAVLRPSHWLASELGPEAKLTFVPAGTLLEAHAPVGVFASSRLGCSLRAPAALVVGDFDLMTGSLSAELEGPLAEELMSEDDYLLFANAEG